MEHIPTELKDELLHASGQNFVSLCRTNREFFNLCSSSSFWREKFRREDIPIVEEGYDYDSWLEIYKKSVNAKRRTETLVSQGYEQLFWLPLYLVRNPEVIMVPGVDSQVVEKYIKLAHEQAKNLFIAQQELEELQRDYSYEFSEVYSGEFTEEEVTPELAEILDRIEELQETISEINVNSVYLTVYHKKDYIYELNEETREEKYKEDFVIDEEELYDLLFRLYYYGLI